MTNTINRALLGYLALAITWLLARTASPIQAAYFLVGLAIILAVAPARRALAYQRALTEFHNEFRQCRLEAKRRQAYGPSYYRVATRRASLHVGGN